MAFVTDLPREAENQDFVILSPKHGFSALTLPLLGHKLTTITLNVRFGLWEAYLRIYLENSEVFADPSRDYVLHVTSARGEFLDQDGKETGHFVDTSFYLIMSVPDANTIAGSLRMWGQQEISSLPDRLEEKQ